MGLLVAVLASAEPYLAALADLCGFVGGSCRDTAAYSLFGQPVALWGIAYYVVLLGCILKAPTWTFRLVMAGVGVEATFFYALVAHRNFLPHLHAESGGGGGPGGPGISPLACLGSLGPGPSFHGPFPGAFYLRKPAAAQSFPCGCAAGRRRPGRRQTDHGSGSGTHHGGPDLRCAHGPIQG